MIKISVWDLKLETEFDFQVPILDRRSVLDIKLCFQPRLNRSVTFGR